LPNKPTAEPYYGFQIDQIDKECIIVLVEKGSPAEKAGFRLDDIVKKFDGKDVASFDTLRDWYKKKEPVKR